MGKLARSSTGQLPSSRMGIGRGAGSLLLALGAVLLIGGQTRALAQACFTWVDSTPSPVARGDHAMAYDSVRGVTVLFGGAEFTGGDYGDTWEWDGTSWTLRGSSGPSPRDGHALAYDSARGVTVLFGGYRYSGETWEWDGTSWTLRSSSGPSPRNRPGMSYDSARGVAVLFGGDDGSKDGETWEGTGSWYVLTLTLKDPGQSWVDIDPNEPNWAPLTYPCGRTLTLTAVPVGNKTFKKWKIWDANDPNYFAIDSNNPITIDMVADRKVKAFFKCGGGGIPPLLLLALGALALLRRRG